MAEQRSAASRRLMQVLRSRSGVNLAECFQCQKCSAGCPLADQTDLLPHVLIKKVHFGQEADLLASKHLWLCLSCGACEARCPNGVDLPRVIDELRQLALEQGAEAALPEVPTFHQAVLETLARHGRMYELGMIARLKLRTGDYFKDAAMGVGLLRRGKLRLLASNVREHREVAALFERKRNGG